MYLTCRSKSGLENLSVFELLQLGTYLNTISRETLVPLNAGRKIKIECGMWLVFSNHSIIHILLDLKVLKGLYF